MANWTYRKSKTVNGFRQTNTTSTKGFTSSFSSGGKAGRTTFSQGPTGKVRITNTIRMGDMYFRQSLKGSSVKYPKLRKKKMTKAEANVVLYFYVFVFFFFASFIYFTK